MNRGTYSESMCAQPTNGDFNFKSISACCPSHNNGMCMLWFKFIHGLMFFELVSILFAIVLDYGNEYMTKENKNGTSFKNFAQELNLNHSMYFTFLVLILLPWR